jgi:pSer/pThr/pTyr-binding forkhead associated (FHA) protein
MPDKQCENGHFIDEAWDLCPYCPKGRKETRKVSSAGVPLPSGRPVPSRPQSRVAPPLVRTAALPKTPSQRRYVVGWLVGLNGSQRGESFAVRIGRNVLGRDRRSDIHVDDDLASAHHADLVFRPEERRYILMDANSTNGTFVNESEIQPRRDLGPNDVVRIGTQQFLFVPLCREGFYWEDEGALK